MKEPWDLNLKELYYRNQVLEFLNKHYDPKDRDKKVTLEQIAIDAQLASADAILERNINARYKRGLIVEALNKKDRTRALEIAGADPALRDFVAAYHHGRGREKGEARRGRDLPVQADVMRAELAADARLIRKQFAVTKVTKRLALLLAITHRFNLNLSQLTDADKKLIKRWLGKLKSKASNAARDRRRH